MNEDNNEKIILPHHIQQELCTTRLPYRQGRKLTAVKVYTINSESNHLLIFGVPSLKLRKELKAHFIKFGKLMLFCVSKEHQSEDFTETYHAVYDKIHSARIAKKMMDTKNFFGGSLHVCYAPELETIDETRQKIVQRQTDVINRLKNLKKEAADTIVSKEDKTIMKEHNASVLCKTDIVNEVTTYNVKKLNMGELNTINLKGSDSKKRKHNKDLCMKVKQSKTNSKADSSKINIAPVEIIDCTGVDTDVVTNVNDIQCSTFGKEKIVKIPAKPLNKIVFNLGNKKYV